MGANGTRWDEHISVTFCELRKSHLPQGFRGDLEVRFNFRRLHQRVSLSILRSPGTLKGLGLWAYSGDSGENNVLSRETFSPQTDPKAPYSLPPKTRWVWGELLQNSKIIAVPVR